MTNILETAIDNQYFSKIWKHCRRVLKLMEPQSFLNLVFQFIGSFFNDYFKKWRRCTVDPIIAKYFYRNFTHQTQFLDPSPPPQKIKSRFGKFLNFRLIEIFSPFKVIFLSPKTKIVFRCRKLVLFSKKLKLNISVFSILAKSRSELLNF